jgi:hypothetical protein
VRSWRRSDYREATCRYSGGVIAALERRRTVLVALAPLEMRTAIPERLRNAEAQVADL